MCTREERAVLLRLCALPPPACATRPLLSSWFAQPSLAASLFSLPKLASLGVLEVNPAAAEHARGWYVRLLPAFHGRIREALSSAQRAPWTPPGKATPAASDPAVKAGPAAPPPVTLADLSEHTQASLSSLLNYLVGDAAAEAPPKGVVQMLFSAGLMVTDEDGCAVTSSKGFDFMLLDVHVQIWQLIHQYLTKFLSSQANQDEIRSDILLFLFALPHTSPGTGYPCSLLSPTELSTMRHFVGFGLILHHAESNTFYPTSVACSLLSGTVLASSSPDSSPRSSPAALLSLRAALSRPSVAGSPHLAIVAQTNFSVVAYTSSRLHVAMLGLFCDAESMVRMPNMLVCMMSRDSVKHAIEVYGISAKQITTFLKQHAHPSVLADPTEPVVPRNVEDQIFLWEKE
ncbi:hypothetical protein TeGR_g5840, partial [Tetraparma gracilis]